MDERNEYQRVKTKLHRKVLGRLDLQKLASTSSSTARDEVLLLIRSMIAAEAVPLSAAERERLAQEIRDEIFGLGPLEPLLKDSWPGPAGTTAEGFYDFRHPGERLQQGLYRACWQTGVD